MHVYSCAATFHSSSTAILVLLVVVLPFPVPCHTTISMATSTNNRLTLASQLASTTNGFCQCHAIVMSSLREYLLKNTTAEWKNQVVKSNTLRSALENEPLGSGVKITCYADELNSQSSISIASTNFYQGSCRHASKFVTLILCPDFIRAV